jgi:hypothetical protein
MAPIELWPSFPLRSRHRTCPMYLLLSASGIEATNSIGNSASRSGVRGRAIEGILPYLRPPEPDAGPPPPSADDPATQLVDLGNVSDRFVTSGVACRPRFGGIGVRCRTARKAGASAADNETVSQRRQRLRGEIGAFVRQYSRKRHPGHARTIEATAVSWSSRSSTWTPPSLTSCSATTTLTRRARRAAPSRCRNARQAAATTCSARRPPNRSDLRQPSEPALRQGRFSRPAPPTTSTPRSPRT